MSIRRNSITRNIEAAKASVPSIGRGVPSDARGDEGDIAFRRTSEGLKLYIKANRKWYGIKVGESFNSLEKKVNEIKSKVDNIKKFRLPSIYSVAGDFTLDASGDITLSADGGNVIMNGGSGSVLDIDVDNSSATFKRISNDATGPILILQKERSSQTASDDDYIGNIQFKTYDDASTPELITGGEIRCQLLDASENDEIARLELSVLTDAYADGSDTPGVFLRADGDNSGSYGVIHTSLGSVGGNTKIHGTTITFQQSNLGSDATDGKITLAPLATSGNPSIKMESGADDGDYVKMEIAADGATTLSTVDDDGTSANLTLDVDGDIKLDAVASLPSTGIRLLNSGTEFANFNVHHSATYFRMYENGGASTDDYADIRVYAHGEMRIVTKDTFAAEADIKLLPDGDIILEPVAGGPKIKESADAAADSAGYGQIWVHDTTPNELCFTDDAGTDIIGIGKYQYETKVTNFYATATANFLPLAGYVFEKTSMISSNEFVALVAPFNGTLERAVFRSEIAQNGDLIFALHESADGTEIPALGAVGSKTTAINIADDTSQVVDFDSMTSGSNVITKGRIYAIKLTTPSGPQDTNVTLVFKWDITS